MSTPDKNFLSFAGRRPLGEHYVGDLTPPPGTADTLKVTGCEDGHIIAGHVIGGDEDCCDVNNKTRDVTIEALLWEPKGKFIFTCKGGSSDITYKGNVRGHGKVVDVDLGNISDQSDNVTGRVKLDLDHEDRDPITVRILGAVRPIFLNSDQQEYHVIFAIPGFWQSLFLKCYKFLKRLGFPI